MTTDERSTLIELVKVVHSILKKHKIHWIPIGGNLLAIYRHEKLLIPWDDDYDIVVEDSKVQQALQILQQELPNYHASILKYKPWGKEGTLYKIFFLSTHPTLHIHTYTQHQHTWPFIDLFVNVEHMPGLNKYACNLKPEELPLIQKTIEGIDIEIPSKGLRTYKQYKDEGYIDECKGQWYSHKFEKLMPCEEPLSVPCHTLL